MFEDQPLRLLLCQELEKEKLGYNFVETQLLFVCIDYRSCHQTLH